MTKRAYIQTFGCQMNEHDTQRMREVLCGLGYADAAVPEEASLILLNTCSVRENPENKVYSQLGRLRPLKAKNPDLIIGVGGCVAQQEGESILDREKSVDMVFGPDNIFRLREMIERVGAGERVVMTTWQHRPADRIVNFIPEEWVERGHVEGCKAYIAITKGCDNFCTFCIVPRTRGREVSREPGSILQEARSLAARGAKEVWLLGQNVNSYKAGNCGFYELLDAVSQVEGLLRLRFTSPHPNDWDNTLSDLMATRPAICPQLHLPFQAGSNAILAAMRRGHTIEDYLAKVAYLKHAVPGIELSADLIVGFPGETEEDFAGTLRVLEEVRFAQIFAFKYSPRPKTAAASLDDDVPRQAKEERLQRVIALQERIQAEQLSACVGQTHEVLIDGPHGREPGIMNGRTPGFRPVSVRTDAALGDCIPVRITGWRNHWLEGEVVTPAAQS